MDFGKKKKKKKPVEDLLKEAEETSAPSAQTETAATEGVANEDEILELGKKKKKGKVIFDEEKNEVVEFSQPITDKTEELKALTESDGSGQWQGSERDYTYEELLTRVFIIMREKNPDMVTGEKRKFVMKPPEVNRIGTKKTSFSNFSDICRLLRRQEKHLLNFLLIELGTSGSLDINNQLTIKGKFQQKQIENVLRRYISNLLLISTKLV